MNNHPPFFIKKEKNNHSFTQITNKSKISNNSLNNVNIIKINSYNNHESNKKNEIVQPKKEEANKSSSGKQITQFNSGRWTKEEHNRFLKGIIEYGNNWKMAEKLIKTRSSSQARSHAQKYFLKVKKKIISQKKVFNFRNLLNYVFNFIKNFNEGKSLDETQIKRILNLLISNYQNFGKDEIESCNMAVSEIKNIENDGNIYTLYKKKIDKNRIPEKNSLSFENKDNSYSKKNSDFDKKLCNKKRKNSEIVNKIFKINKVAKYKYSNNVNKINQKSNKKIFSNLNISNNIICPIIDGNYIINKNITNITNNYNNFISNNSINNNEININIKNNRYYSKNNNFKNNNNINDISSFDINKFNCSEQSFDFVINIRENKNFDEDEYPKYNTLESQKKLFFIGNELNDSFKNNFFEENLFSLGEPFDENSIINKLNDLFE